MNSNIGNEQLVSTIEESTTHMSKEAYSDKILEETLKIEIIIILNKETKLYLIELETKIIL